MSDDTQYTLTGEAVQKLADTIKTVSTLGAGGTDLTGRLARGQAVQMPVCLVTLSGNESGAGVYDCSMCSPHFTGTDFDPTVTPTISALTSPSGSTALYSNVITGYAINLAEAGGTGHSLDGSGTYPAILWMYNSDGKAVFFIWAFDFVGCT